MAVVSTTDGRYFLRVADHSKPVTGDDVMRLASKRAARPWETQTTARRNEHLVRLFQDLKPMERQGSGLDKIFKVLLSQGRPMPELIETHDRVQVTVRRRILKPEVIDFIAKADQTYQQWAIRPRRPSKSMPYGGHRQCWTVDSDNTEPIEYQDAPLSTNVQQLANFIWSVADRLRGPYRPPQYERVMLPLTVLRRFDAVLARFVVAPDRLSAGKKAGQ